MAHYFSCLMNLCLKHVKQSWAKRVWKVQTIMMKIFEFFFQILAYHLPSLKSWSLQLIKMTTTEYRTGKKMHIDSSYPSCFVKVLLVAFEDRILKRCVEYWAICSFARSFTRTFHSFACSAPHCSLCLRTPLYTAWQLAHSLGKEIHVYEVNTLILYSFSP